MSDIERVGGALDVDQDLSFQQRQWRVQRVGWVVMVLIVLAALAGLLGPGPLSRSYAADPSGAVAVEFNRFERNSRQTELRVRAAGSAIQQGRVRLWIDVDYAAKLRVLSIAPEPVLVEAERDRLIYHFAATAGAAEVPITIHYEHLQFGSASGRIGIVAGPEVAVEQLVYP